MENVGAVTFNERYIYRTKVTVDRRRQRADTILHEMAHMWFGDLVTMRWWNGLWLNESFATFMAAKAVNEATTFKGSWEDFFGDKEWAYWEDQLVTTHPIEVPVFDTDKASSIFDGISYGKGAASLKQLAFLLGEDDFREGLQRYFQKFAFRNTTLADFIKSLSEASGKDLNKWQKTWLLTSGVDPVSVEWRCSSSGKLDHMSLNYGKRDDRQHRTIVGLYRMKNGKLRSDRSITVLSDVNPKIYSEGKLLEQDSRGAGATTTEIPCPDFVYPNQGDYDYAKVDLDPISTKTAHESLSKFEDAFLRRMVWHDLWQMVVDSKLRAQDYADIVLKHIPKETDTKVLGHVLSTITDPFGDSLLRYLAPELRNEVRAKAEEVVRKQLLVAQGGSDAQLVWFKAFYETAHAPESMELVRKLLSGKAKLNKLTMDQEHRWDLIQALAREGGKEAADLIAADLKKDDTDMGQKAAIMAQVQIPTSENKAAWLAKITKRELPYPKLKEAMRKYHIMGQEALSQAAVDAYFEMIPKLRTLEDQEFAKRFAGAMYPDLCDSAIVQKTTEVLNANGDLPTTIAKALKVGRQEQERCVLARAKSASSG